MKEIRLKKRRAKIIVFLCIVIGYGTIYKPRVETKNYASCAAICLAGVEANLVKFETASPRERKKILNRIPGMWQKFCEIDCPDSRRAVEIQWKTAKLVEYTESFIKQEMANIYMGNESNEALRNIKERIADLKYLIDDTIAYGNFKRL